MAVVQITYFTDPLCSWCWAFEPHWRRLRYEFGDQLSWRYRMGGLIADWARYHDPLNEISRPGQMGPQWLHVQKITGMPLNPKLWQENPPTSSYPACIALKAAETFGPAFAELYLRRLREAAMLEARDISQPAVLQELAAEANRLLAPEEQADLEAFAAAAQGESACEAFREDIKEVRFREIGRFPTLILHRSGETGLMLTGYRPYAALREALKKVAPDLEPVRAADDLAHYVAHWRRITIRELAEAFDAGLDEVRAGLQRLGIEEDELADAAR